MRAEQPKNDSAQLDLEIRNVQAGRNVSFLCRMLIPCPTFRSIIGISLKPLRLKLMDAQRMLDRVEYLK